MHAKLIQSCLSLCNPMDYTPPSPYVHGIPQARILEWVAMASSRRPSRPRHRSPPALAGRFFTTAVAAAKSLQSCLTVQPCRWQPTRLLCPCSSPGKNTGVGCHFLLQCMHACMLSCFSHVQLYATLGTASHQAPLYTGFSRQEHWSGLPFPSP